MDLNLARDVLDGHPEARREFVLRMRCVSRILAARNARMGHPLTEDELADLSQDTLLRVWRKLGTFSGRASLETWVYRFCYLELMNTLRKKARLPRRMSELSEDATLEPRTGDAGGVVPVGEDGGIATFLRHLAGREAEVVRLRHVEQLSFNEVAGLLEISSSSVKTHYYRALEKLRSIFAPLVHGGME